MRHELAHGVRACITCALARRALRLAATTTSSLFSSSAARCAPSPRLLPPSQPSPPRSSHSPRAALLCAAHTCPSAFAHGPQRLWTAALGTLPLATWGAAGKWQIRKWPFATVLAVAARSVVLCVLYVLVRIRASSFYVTSYGLCRIVCPSCIKSVLCGVLGFQNIYIKMQQNVYKSVKFPRCAPNHGGHAAVAGPTAQHPILIY
jgi:hypothetical protein